MLHQFKKQTVYIPVKEVSPLRKIRLTPEMLTFVLSSYNTRSTLNGITMYTPAFITQADSSSDGLEHTITHNLYKRRLYVFTEEQLTELIAKLSDSVTPLQLIDKFKSKVSSEKVQLDNLDYAKLVFNGDEVVVENEHGTRFSVDSLSARELKIFYDNI